MQRQVGFESAQPGGNTHHVNKKTRNQLGDNHGNKVIL